MSTRTYHLDICHLVYREQLAEWVRANGIDPDIVPIQNTITIDGRLLWLDVFAGGRPRLDPETRQVAKVRLCFPLLAPWPFPESQ